MGTYFVGEGDEHRVDHPPIFACQHKQLLKLSPRFVAELLATAQDIMPGNPDEICGSFLKQAQPAYRLPEFLIPPKVVLFNPRGLRGPEALPYTVILIDKKFFGIPARYLTPDRFTGCEECLERLRAARRRRSGAAASSNSDRRPPPAPAPKARPRPRPR